MIEDLNVHVSFAVKLKSDSNTGGGDSNSDDDGLSSSNGSMSMVFGRGDSYLGNSNNALSAINSSSMSPFILSET